MSLSAEEKASIEEELETVAGPRYKPRLMAFI